MPGRWRRPFSELLDGAAPAAEPPPAPQQARPDRAADRPDRPDQPKPANDRGSEAKPVQDRTDNRTHDSDEAADANAADSTDQTKSAKNFADGKAADIIKNVIIPTTKDGKAAASDEAGGKPKSDVDQKAALDAMFVDPAAPAPIIPQVTAATVVAIVQPVVLDSAPAEAAAPEADALAALAAAGQGRRVAPDAAIKPGQTQAGKPADAETKGAAHGEPQATVPQIEAAKDGQADGNHDPLTSNHDPLSSNRDPVAGNRDKALSDFHRVAADLLTKPDGNAPAQQGGDAPVATKAGADATQNPGVATPASTANPAAAPVNPAIAATNAPAQTPGVAVPLSGLAVEITAQAHAGKNHFDIRLDPPDLGRIHVSLDVDRDGNVSTRLVVDRADTLDLLKRDASSLERALQQAGLKTSDHALDFSLRQHAFAHDDTGPQSGTHLIVPEDDPAPLEALRQGYGRLLGLGRGLDIRV